MRKDARLAGVEIKVAAALAFIIVLPLALFWVYGRDNATPVQAVSGTLSDAGSATLNSGRSPSPAPPSPTLTPGRDASEPRKKSTPPRGTPGAASPAGPVSSGAASTGADSTARPAAPPPAASGSDNPMTPRLVEMESGSFPGRPAEAQTTGGPPAPSAAHPAAPASSAAEVATDRHIVQVGDTWPSIARMYFGRDDAVAALRQANPALAGDTLPVGTVVLIPAAPGESGRLADAASPPRPAPPTAAPSTTSPPSASPSATAPANSGARPAGPGPGAANAARGSATTPGKRTYVVKSGDTFYGISRSVLGSAARWRELYELNRDLVSGDPRNLRPGQKLTLPDA